jgi:type II secretory pathway predicted ATPase ExeA
VSDLRTAFEPSGAPGYFPHAGAERALTSLEGWALASQRPVIVVAGEPGMGKTLLLRVLAGRLGDRFQTVSVDDPGADFDGLCRHILDTLGHAPEGPPRAILPRALERLAGEGRALLLLIDQAEALPARTEMWLFDLARRSSGSLRIVLATSQARLAAEFAVSFGAETEIVTLDDPLSREESDAYVRAALARAGAGAEERARFDEPVLAVIHARSAGVPGRLDQEVAALLREPAPRTAGPREEAAPAGRLPEASEAAAATALPETAHAPERAPQSRGEGAPAAPAPAVGTPPPEPPPTEIHEPEALPAPAPLARQPAAARATDAAGVPPVRDEATPRGVEPAPATAAGRASPRPAPTAAPRPEPPATRPPPRRRADRASLRLPVAVAVGFLAGFLASRGLDAWRAPVPSEAPIAAAVPAAPATGSAAAPAAAPAASGADRNAPSAPAAVASTPATGSPAAQDTTTSAPEPPAVSSPPPPAARPESGPGPETAASPPPPAVAPGPPQPVAAEAQEAAGTEAAPVAPPAEPTEAQPTAAPAPPEPKPVPAAAPVLARRAEPSQRAVRPVVVTVTSEASATIAIDGQTVGTAPVQGVRLAPGPHRFAARLADGREVEQVVDVTGTRFNVTFR